MLWCSVFLNGPREFYEAQIWDHGGLNPAFKDLGFFLP